MDNGCCESRLLSKVEELDCVARVGKLDVEAPQSAKRPQGIFVSIVVLILKTRRTTGSASSLALALSLALLFTTEERFSA